MKIGPTFTVEQILKLFKDNLGVDIKAPGLFFLLT